MKILFDSPWQAEVDVIDYGIIVKRGEVVDVSDDVAEALLTNPHFSRADGTAEVPASVPEPSAAAPNPTQPPTPPPSDKPEPEST